MNALAEQFEVPRGLEMHGLERPLPSGNDHRPTRVVCIPAFEEEMIPIPREFPEFLIQDRLGSELEALGHHVLGLVFRQNFRDAADVEDVLLRVERHELPSQFRKGIDDPRKDSTDTRVERPEEAGWLTTYDREIKNFVRHDWSKFGSLASDGEAEIGKFFLGNGLQE